METQQISRLPFGKHLGRKTGLKEHGVSDFIGQEHKRIAVGSLERVGDQRYGLHDPVGLGAAFCHTLDSMGAWLSGLHTCSFE
jgi:hypothetical protein